MVTDIEKLIEALSDAEIKALIDHNELKDEGGEPIEIDDLRQTVWEERVPKRLNYPNHDVACFEGEVLGDTTVYLGLVARDKDSDQNPRIFWIKPLEAAEVALSSGATH